MEKRIRFRHKTKDLVRLGKKNAVTDALRTLILQDVAKKITQAVIAKKYGVCSRTVSRIIQKDGRYIKPNIQPGTPVSNFEPYEILKRAELDNLKRLELLSDDGMQVIELSFAAMKYMLLVELNISKDSNHKTGDLTPKAITDFLVATAPYILPKVDNVKKTKPNPNDSSNINHIREMWKRQQNYTKIS